jgi:predicted DNA-binding transcriptional regulator AlpA
MDEVKVVDWKGLKALGIPYSRAHIWRMMKAGDFPSCFKLMEHRNSHPVWWLSEIIAWLRSRSH